MAMKISRQAVCLVLLLCVAASQAFLANHFKKGPDDCNAFSFNPKKPMYRTEHDNHAKEHAIDLCIHSWGLAPDRKLTNCCFCSDGTKKNNCRACVNAPGCKKAIKLPDNWNDYGSKDSTEFCVRYLTECCPDGGFQGCTLNYYQDGSAHSLAQIWGNDGDIRIPVAKEHVRPFAGFLVQKKGKICRPTSRTEYEQRVFCQKMVTHFSQASLLLDEKWVRTNPKP
eukprot:GILI01009072.1.p2 GENE.GILI01009072.1~~GILI01009072.1.p2  ORF type:complete len:225 (-),score=57.37 GILI01009072.1:673-1347(-)